MKSLSRELLLGLALVSASSGSATVSGGAAAAPDDQKADVQKLVFARVFPQPGQIGLFIAAADGSNERALVTRTDGSADADYDTTWSPAGAAIVFTSERNGSADLYRVRSDGSGLERLTDSPAYDDQAVGAYGLQGRDDLH